MTKDAFEGVCRYLATTSMRDDNVIQLDSRFARVLKLVEEGPPLVHDEYFAIFLSLCQILAVDNTNGGTVLGVKQIFFSALFDLVSRQSGVAALVWHAAHGRRAHCV